MTRLVVVSNRCNLPRKGQAPGGLAVALTSAVRERGGLWFGWDGNVSAGRDRNATVTRIDGADYATIPLSLDAYEGYYKGYANRVLWPLCHYRPDSISYQHRHDREYRRTNERFARKLVPLLQPQDLLWIHDYHLVPLGRALRAAGVERAMGFFFHIPFPPHELLRILPGHRQLLEEFAAYDLVGFQTEADKSNFLHALACCTDARVGTDGAVSWNGRRFQVAAFPISIDPQEVRAMVTSGRDSRTVRRLETSLQNRSLLIGVDRLDYSKGLPDRFQAYRRLLTNYPQTHGKVVFLQVAEPSRADVPEYRLLREQLESLVGDINGHFAEFDWAPIRYINKSYARSTVMNFLSIARVGLVTPLRDGMNLVAKEYVAAQSPEDPGVLVLSQFAGAAKELEAALLVNPYDPDAVADAVATALDMPLAERRERWQHSFDVVSRYDVFEWTRAFLAALENCTPHPLAPGDLESSGVPPFRDAADNIGDAPRLASCPAPIARADGRGVVQIGRRGPNGGLSDGRRVR